MKKPRDPYEIMADIECNMSEIEELEANGQVQSELWWELQDIDYELQLELDESREYYES